MEDPVHIDCNGCPARGTGCEDCLVVHMLDVMPDPEGLPLDPREARAVHAFMVAGLVSPTEAGRVRAARTTAVLAGVG